MSKTERRGNCKGIVDDRNRTRKERMKMRRRGQAGYYKEQDKGDEDE